MKINDAVIEAVKEICLQIEEEKEYPYEKCPICGSDDFDYINHVQKKCYACQRIFDEEEIKNIYANKFAISFTNMIIQKTGKFYNKLKAVEIK